MTKPRVLVRTKLNYHNPCPIISHFEQRNVDVDLRPGQAPWPEEETRDCLEGAAGILAGGDYANELTLEKAGELKVIARSGVGFDRIDLELCTERRIVVTNAPGAMADAVADEAMALMLALIRRLPEGDGAVKKGDYAVGIAEDLASMSLGLVGCGKIGAEVVRRARAFKMEVLVFDPFVEVEQISALGAVPVSREKLLAGADVVSLHTPLTDDNAKMVDAGFLKGMKPKSLLINTARGGLIDEEALIACLSSGHLAGAGLDCQSTEPPVGRSLELVRMEQVIAMPHAASNTVTARERMALWAARSIVDCLQGRVPKHVVNTAVLAKLPELTRS